MTRVASARGIAALLATALLPALAAVVAHADEGRVGADTCAVCHEDLAAGFARNLHHAADPEGSCESCHGPGEAHAEAEGDPERILRFGDGTDAAESSGACLDCHGRERPHRGWKHSEHAAAGLSCASCHGVHGSPEQSADGDAGLCTDCHADVRARFELTESHPVGRGGMSCIDCHDPHAASERRLLGGFKQSACLSCHSEYRGPWFFEHEVVAVEGCTACHAPHGSVNRHLLTYQRVGDLCLQCHPGQPFFHDATDDGGERTTGINDCTRCHSEIHGSNNDALFLN